jgi:hypothetical protein
LLETPHRQPYRSRASHAVGEHCLLEASRYLDPRERISVDDLRLQPLLKVRSEALELRAASREENPLDGTNLRCLREVVVKRPANLGDELIHFSLERLLDDRSDRRVDVRRELRLAALDLRETDLDLQVLGFIECEVEDVRDRLRELVAGERRDPVEPGDTAFDNGDVRDPRGDMDDTRGHGRWRTTTRRSG